MHPLTDYILHRSGSTFCIIAVCYMQLKMIFLSLTIKLNDFFTHIVVA